MTGPGLQSRQGDASGPWRRARHRVGGLLLATLSATAVAELPPCPATPNCVSSEAADTVHGIAPLQLEVEAAAAWAALAAHLDEQPRFTVVERSDTVLRLEARSRLLRFVDDVTFELRPEANLIAMRSASRIGISDLGANRRRLERIRSALAATGVVRAAEEGQ